MRRPARVELFIGLAFATFVATAALQTYAQPINQSVAQPAGPLNSLPNPYRSVENWARMPEGRIWGQTAGVYVDRAGTGVWVAERCGGDSCTESSLPPILHFDASGRLLRAFGADLFNFPHGIFVDREGSVWVTDAPYRVGAQGGKGHQVFKFNPEGKVLLALGKPGVAGDGPDEFNMPSAVLIAPNGDIFVGDGHGRDSNARIVKFDKNGKFIKTWGRKGSAPGEFDTPHTLAMDSRGRLFVGDRQNNRIQIFDQNGNFIDQWFQFSRPSSIYIDKDDNMFVADSESESVSKNHDGWKRGIRIGRVSDGVVTAFIPDPVEKATSSSAAEGMTVDAAGNVYGAEVTLKRLMKYMKN
jgi:DNA-binding beta-propeller fold protein YncE